MNIEKTIRITISKKEQEILQQAEGILSEVCDAFPDCEECPFYNLCGEGQGGKAPQTMLYHCIKALPVED